MTNPPNLLSDNNKEDISLGALYNNVKEKIRLADMDSNLKGSNSKSI